MNNTADLCSWQLQPGHKPSLGSEGSSANALRRSDFPVGGLPLLFHGRYGLSPAQHSTTGHIAEAPGSVSSSVLSVSPCPLPRVAQGPSMACLPQTYPHHHLSSLPSRHPKTASTRHKGSSVVSAFSVFAYIPLAQACHIT